MAPLNWPAVTVEGGFVTTTPVQPAGTFILDDATNGKLDTGTLGADVTFSDLTAYTRSGRISRPSSRQMGPLYDYGAGTCSIALKNGDGRFDTDNLAGPYTAAGASELLPMVPLRISATWAGVLYRLFYGYVDSWDDDGQNYAGRYAETIVAATDGQKILGGIQVRQDGGSAGTGETTGARINRILNAAPWYSSTSYRIIAAGSSTLQAFGGLSNGTSDSAWNLLQQAADNEIGELYLDGAGAVVFRGRQQILTDTRSNTPQAIFGDKAGVLHPEWATPAELNSNPGFAGNINGWSSLNGATIVFSTDFQYGTDTGVLKLHGDGVTAGPGAVTTATGLSPATQYTATAVLYTPVAASMHLQIDWFDGSSVFISSSTGPSITSSTAWQVPTITATSPANTASAHLFFALDGTPSSGTLLYAGWSSLIAGDTSTIPAELAYTAAVRARDDTTLANDIHAQRTGGTLQEVQDTASQVKYLFPRTYDRQDLILQNDTDVINWASWVLYVAKDGESRIDQITIEPLRDPVNLWPHALGRQIGDRIEVWRRPPGLVTPVARDGFIRDIEHTFDVSANNWTTSWELQDAAKYGGFLTLDNPILGRLNFNALAY